MRRWRAERRHVDERTPRRWHERDDDLGPGRDDHHDDVRHAPAGVDVRAVHAQRADTAALLGGGGDGSGEPRRRGLRVATRSDIDHADGRLGGRREQPRRRRRDHARRRRRTRGRPRQPLRRQLSPRRRVRPHEREPRGQLAAAPISRYQQLQPGPGVPDGGGGSAGRPGDTRKRRGRVAHQPAVGRAAPPARTRARRVHRPRWLGLFRDPPTPPRRAQARWDAPRRSRAGAHAERLGWRCPVRRHRRRGAVGSRSRQARASMPVSPPTTP